MERAVTHLSHLWQTKSQDGEDRKGERERRAEEKSAAKENNTKTPQKYTWNKVKDKGKQKQPVVWNTTEWELG